MFCNVAHIQMFQRIEFIYVTQTTFSLFVNNYQVFFIKLYIKKSGFHFQKKH